VIDLTAKVYSAWVAQYTRTVKGQNRDPTVSVQIMLLTCYLVSDRAHDRAPDKASDKVSCKPLTGVLSRWCACLLLMLGALHSAVGLGHEVPDRVQLRLFLQVENGALVVLLRMPLEALRDIDFPQQGQGYLNIEQSESALDEAINLWLIDEIQLFQSGRPLPRGQLQRAKISLPADRSFQSYATALNHMKAAPLTNDTLIYWRQALVDVQLQYVLNDSAGDFAWDANLDHLGQQTQSLLTFTSAAGEARLFEYEGNSGRLALDPNWYQVIPGFIDRGMTHLLTGIDHILFLLCLVLPVRRLWPLIGIVTAFTLGHSITLLSAALGWVPNWIWFPALVEASIAASILYVALENILSIRTNHRWLIALGFGLIHGYGFSFQLQEALQLAGSHLVVALLAFNLGVEIGQVILLLGMLLSLWLALKVVSRPQWLVIVVSALVAHSAWHWLLARGTILAAYFPGGW
jgi:hypothetical protein